MIFLISTFMGCGGNHNSDNYDTPIKSLAEITAEMKKVTTIDSWDAVVGEQDPLGKIAMDLKRSLPKPIGEFASRTILLQKRLIILLHSDMDRKNKENIINETLNDANQLKNEIDESIWVTPENEIVNLKRLNGISKSTEESQAQAEKIKVQITVNSAEDDDEEEEPLVDRRKEVAQRNKELKLKLEVASGTGLLKERLEE